MRFVSDESGGFNLAKEGFELSLWSTIVCPDSVAGPIADQVAKWCRQWDLPELHATQMSPAQRSEVAAFVGAQDVIWLVTAIDSEIMTAQEAEEWRQDQIAKFESDFAASRDRGTTHPRYVGREDQIRRLLARVPLPQFVQFGIVAPRHIAECVQAAIVRFREPRWQPDWERCELAFDPKNLGAAI